MSNRLRFLAAPKPIPVTIRKPRSNRPPIEGMFLGGVYSATDLRYHRIQAGNVVYQVPSLWLTPETWVALTDANFWRDTVMPWVMAGGDVA